MSIAENHGGIYKNLSALRHSNGQCEHNWFKAWGFDYKYLEEGNDVDFEFLDVVEYEGNGCDDGRHDNRIVEQDIKQ